MQVRAVPHLLTQTSNTVVTHRETVVSFRNCETFDEASRDQQQTGKSTKRSNFMFCGVRCLFIVQGFTLHSRRKHANCTNT